MRASLPLLNCRSGSIAWNIESRPLFAEPPAESPSTTYSSTCAILRNGKSASFAGQSTDVGGALYAAPTFVLFTLRYGLALASLVHNDFRVEVFQNQVSCSLQTWVRWTPRCAPTWSWSGPRLRHHRDHRRLWPSRISSYRQVGVPSFLQAACGPWRTHHHRRQRAAEALGAAPWVLMVLAAVCTDPNTRRSTNADLHCARCPCRKSPRCCYESRSWC